MNKRTGRKFRELRLSLWGTLRFRLIAASKGNINLGLQKVTEDPEKVNIGLFGTGRICPRKKASIINEVPTDRVCAEVYANIDQSPTKRAFLNNGGSENTFQKVAILQRLWEKKANLERATVVAWKGQWAGVSLSWAPNGRVALPHHFIL